jgi:curved DNA-binding protein CbpA
VIVPAARPDPYQTLGVSRNAADAEVRAAYRRLVQLHHPDHNGGSAEAAVRFEAVQEAYAEVRRLRAGGAGARGARRAGSDSAARASDDPSLDQRLADIERELREANAARERARRAAREAAAAARGNERPDAPRATDEELGYVSTDDSLTKILADARDELFGRASEAGAAARPAAHRVADLLDELAAKLRGE